MKTSIDIPKEALEEIMRHTRAGTKREAVLMAITEYNRRCRVEKVLGFLGTMDGIMTADELRQMREDA